MNFATRGQDTTLTVATSATSVTANSCGGDTGLRRKSERERVEDVGQMDSDRTACRSDGLFGWFNERRNSTEESMFVIGTGLDYIRDN